MTTNQLQEMSDEALVAETKRVAEVERRSMAELLELLIEVERRSLCHSLGCSSLFVYCTRVLGLSEQAAYSRISAARAARRFPRCCRCWPMARSRSAVSACSRRILPRRIRTRCSRPRSGSPTREVEKIVACAIPQPDVPASVRALPTSRSRRWPARRYLLRVTIGEDTHAKLDRARALLRHVIPNGDPAAILDRAPHAAD